MAKKALPLDCLLPELEETRRVLGRGAYGEVVEVLLHGTKVAGKKINCKDSESDVKSRIKQECNKLVCSTVSTYTCLVWHTVKYIVRTVVVLSTCTNWCQ